MANRSRRVLRCAFVLVFVLIARDATAADAGQPSNENNADTSIASDSSREFKGKTVLELIEELELTNRHLREFEDKASDLNNHSDHIQVCIAQVKDTRVDDDRINMIKPALTELKQRVTDYTSTSNNTDTSKLRDSVFGAFNALDDAVYYADYWRKFAPARDSKSNVVSSLSLNPKKADSSKRTLEVLLSEATKADQNVFRDKLAAEIKSLDPNELVTQYTSTFDATEKELSNLNSTVERAKQANQNDIKKSRKDLVLIEQEIARKAGGQEGTFNLVYWMMGLLLALFVLSISARLALAFKFGGVNFAGIIDEKTLIEFGGMAFILLTIIILGNTEKLDRQALGPLLGTIAGYIFGKGIASATVTHVDVGEKKRHTD